MYKIVLFWQLDERMVCGCRLPVHFVIAPATQCHQCACWAQVPGLMVFHLRFSVHWEKYLKP